MKKEHMTKGIYAIICKANGKIYIGSSMNIYSRKRNHFNKMKRNEYIKPHAQLQEDYNLYGAENFKFVIIEELNTDSYDFLLQKETDYIIRFGTFFEDKGYNLSIPTERIYRKAFIEKYGEEFLRELVYSSDEILEKEDWVYEKQYRTRKVYQIDSSNVVVKVWNSMKEIADYFNIKPKMVRKLLLGFNKGDRIITKCKNHIWIEEEKYDINFNYSVYWIKPIRIKKEKAIKSNKPRARNGLKSLSLRNIETGEIREFDSRRLASRELSIPIGSIRNLIRGYKSKGGGVKVNITQWRGWEIVK